jgi:ABC-2 type transport system ATP-binding protein
LLEPSAGDVRVFGRSPREQNARMLPRLSFVAQDHPLYRDFTAGDLLTMGRWLNPRWDDALARTRLQNLGIPLDRRASKLSAGQQAQVALVLALAKRPDLLLLDELLDEPLASLDPLARRDFLRTLMDAQLETGLTLLLSSHIIGAWSASATTLSSSRRRMCSLPAISRRSCAHIGDWLACGRR